MENNNNLQVISLFELDKQGRESFVINVIEAMGQGQVEPILVHLQVKGMEKLIEDFTSNQNYKKLVLDSVSQYGQKDVQFHNAKFDIKEVGVKYDYTQCGDIELEEMSKQVAALNENIKAKQK